MRVVSLVPSSTETLLALDADVVACTRFCEQPEIRQVGGTKNPDIAAIVALRPDLVVLDRQENRIEDADDLAAAGLDVFVSDVRTVEQSLAVVGQLARRVGATAPHMAIPVADAQPSVTAFVPIWRRPWMSIGGDTYGASILARVGCRLVTADADSHYPLVDLDAVAAAQPDAVLAPSEPYDFSAAHLDELRGAIPGALVERVDGRDLFWWGTRTPAAIANLAGAIARLAAVRGRAGSEDAGAG